MSLARDERADLADFLTTLTAQQWEAPSLCSAWRVRDVVAHMLSYEELSVGGLIGRFIRGGVLPDRVNAVGVAAYADRSPQELIGLVKDHLQPRSRIGGRAALTVVGGRLVQAVAQLVEDRCAYWSRTDQSGSDGVEVGLHGAFGYGVAGHDRLPSSADTAAANSSHPARVLSRAVAPSAVSW